MPMTDFASAFSFKSVAAGALALLASACSTYERDNYPSASDFPVHGIDVSKYQGDIDWNAVKASGVRFAWIRATEGGDNADEKFMQNWQGAKAAGIPHGAYHFVYWCRGALEQINWFKTHAPVEEDSLPPVLDVELTPGSKSCPRVLNMEQVHREMREMLNEMERYYGKRPVIYSTVDFHQGILDGDYFTEYPMWVRSTKYYPTVKYKQRRWTFWQYQSDAYIPGIVGKVDRNAFFGTEQQWQSFVQGNK